MKILRLQIKKVKLKNLNRKNKTNQKNLLQHLQRKTRMKNQTLDQPLLKASLVNMDSGTLH